VIEEEGVVKPSGAPGAEAEAGERRGLSAANRDRLVGAVAVLIFLVFWEMVVRLGWVNPLFSSSPSRIVKTFVQMLHEGSLGTDLRVSGAEFLVGYFLAVAVGIPLGIAIGWYRGVAAALQPFVSALYATPRVALLPLMIIWLGIGIWSKVAVVFLGGVFQIIINMVAGMRSLDASLLKAAHSFGANDRQIFTTIALPGSVPFLLAGLRLAVGQGLIGVVVGELYAATAGIGYEIAVAGETFQTDRVFVGVIILALAAIIVMWLLQRVEDRFEAWRPQRTA
jgi:ABC-type nitrate/sulfonate/bicarbonate transport system permease component